MAGSGSFRCKQCGYVLTLVASDALGDCPGCGGNSFARASLFSTGHLPTREDAIAPGDSAEHEAWLQEAREGIEAPGDYLVYEEGEERRVVALTREWTRVGRSLAADIRFDDPTVSRRHALVVRQADGVRVLDDRSLNGVFVNGERIEWRVLHDGDEIIVGRYRLGFLSVAGVQSEAQPRESAPRFPRVSRLRSTTLRSVS
jgi:pSer/pThr/pTyr-binding forkhead associated (FHA) protein